VTPKIEAVPATAADFSKVAHMMQLYIHDFSEFWFDQPHGDLGLDGLYALPDNLKTYWEDADRAALLLKRGEVLVGFALLNGHAHSGRAVDWNMGEFFIVRKHRRTGVGTAAAQAVFAKYPGRWETAVARRNVGAQTFWRRLAQTHREFEALDLQSEDWNGPIFRFTVGLNLTPLA